MADGFTPSGDGEIDRVCRAVLAGDEGEADLGERLAALTARVALRQRCGAPCRRLSSGPSGATSCSAGPRGP